ncbi:hypothetical protein [Peribacillus glennii]|uniref:Uncharacterized protein n=1 Tax=Peribacillus glennii TaxID=2303991 RepID=A0A372L6T6_9BACI|nr:hypothetical protein [Peribacillus glennii]RFU60853.1 hypothetical protein D0466_19930 [Peribacillus glennii]
MKEADWFNEPEKTPSASLYKITAANADQKKITNHPEGFSDENPIYNANLLTWLRKSKGLTNSDVWTADTECNDAKPWIQETKSYAIFHK